MQFEAKVEIGHVTLAVQDGLLMTYFPGGEGDSVELAEAIPGLEFILRAAKIARAQEVQSGE